MGDQSAMLPFKLIRHVDITGVSGTGLVAVGVIFPNGRVVVTWLGKVASVTVYDSLADMMKIHLHGGATELEYLPVVRLEAEEGDIERGGLAANKRHMVIPSSAPGQEEAGQ